MREPLGRAVGNALEVREAIDTLHGAGPADLWALTLELGSHQLLMAGLASDADEARATLTALRASGAGARKLAELVTAQHGDARVVDDPSLLASAPVVVTMEADDGEPRWVAEADARAIGDAALVLGAGRRQKGDPIDPAVGIVLRARIGDRVERGHPLADVHARTRDDADAAIRALRAAFVMSDRAGAGRGRRVRGDRQGAGGAVGIGGSGEAGRECRWPYPGGDERAEPVAAPPVLVPARQAGKGCQKRKFQQARPVMIPGFTASFRIAPAVGGTADGAATIRVRDSRPQGRDTGAPAPNLEIRHGAWRAGGSAPLATVVSLPTAREARPGAQRRDTPAPAVRRSRTSPSDMV